MDWMIFAAGFFVLVSISSALSRRKRVPFEDATLDQIPADARQRLAQVAPEFEPHKIRVRQDARRVVMRGQYLGAEASVEVEYAEDGSLHEFEFEAVCGTRLRRGIDASALPEAAAARIDGLLAEHAAKFEEGRVSGGSLRTRNTTAGFGKQSFQWVGRADGLEWEIEVDENGRLLELDIEQPRR